MDNNNMYDGETNPYAPQNAQETQDTQQAPQAPQYQQPQTQQSANLEEPMSMGDWLITFLLLMIPCANIVLVFVWAFSGKEKKSKSNFFKAYLIMLGIILAIYIIIMILVFGIAAAAATMY